MLVCRDTQVGEFAFYRDQLWTAPELLRMTTRPINGTQKADVYSFAIILQEIMFRAEPYFFDVDPPQGMDHGWHLLIHSLICTKEVAVLWAPPSRFQRHARGGMSIVSEGAIATPPPKFLAFEKLSEIFISENFRLK